MASPDRIISRTAIISDLQSIQQSQQASPTHHRSANLKPEAVAPMCTTDHSPSLLPPALEFTTSPLHHKVAPPQPPCSLINPEPSGSDGIPRCHASSLHAGITHGVSSSAISIQSASSAMAEPDPRLLYLPVLADLYQTSPIITDNPAGPIRSPTVDLSRHRAHALPVFFSDQSKSSYIDRRLLTAAKLAPISLFVLYCKGEKKRRIEEKWENTGRGTGGERKRKERFGCKESEAG